MKRITLSLLMLGFVLMSSNLTAQEQADYDLLKLQGLIEQPAEVPAPIGPIPTITPDNSDRSGPGFYVPLDGSFSLAMGPNDDGSAFYALPFTFCFYGDDQTSLYINNNGNVSFGSAYSSFSPTGFPSASYVMIAPFWGDVDTRTCGEVWYKIESNRIIIIWELVGYYSTSCDKLNTFQLIITDGTDATIGLGKTVAFAYEDMSWTTGSASGGSGGFGGSPATVGINKGDGTTYALVGRFDHPGTDFTGSGDINGVDYLDGRRYAFDGCTGVIPDPSVPISNWAILLGIFLIAAFTVVRYRRRLA